MAGRGLAVTIVVTSGVTNSLAESGRMVECETPSPQQTPWYGNAVNVVRILAGQIIGFAAMAAHPSV
ncbi:hypothetical protein Tco_0599496 [Tanacetum coccineum]